jgi:hypothetical protein
MSQARFTEQIEADLPDLLISSGFSCGGDWSIALKVVSPLADAANYSSTHTKGCRWAVRRGFHR